MIDVASSAADPRRPVGLRWSSSSSIVTSTLEGGGAGRAGGDLAAARRPTDGRDLRSERFKGYAVLSGVTKLSRGNSYVTSSEFGAGVGADALIESGRRDCSSTSTS